MFAILLLLTIFTLILGFMPFVMNFHLWRIARKKNLTSMSRIVTQKTDSTNSFVSIKPFLITNKNILKESLNWVNYLCYFVRTYKEANWLLIPLLFGFINLLIWIGLIALIITKLNGVSRILLSGSLMIELIGLQILLHAFLTIPMIVRVLNKYHLAPIHL